MDAQSGDIPGGDPTPAAPAGTPSIVGDVVFGDMGSPVAVCTLGSRSLLPELAGRPEIAVAGRVFTENVGVERMIQNLLGLRSVRFLMVCGRETQHHVGQTILALHRNGLDPDGRVIGSQAPEPIMPNLQPDQLRDFQQRIIVDDMMGITDAAAIIARAAALPQESPSEHAAGDDASVGGTRPDVEHVAATRDSQSAWQYDPAGYFLVFVDRDHTKLRAEHYSQQHQLLRVIEGRAAEDVAHTVVRLGLLTLLPHAMYLGRELARAETALNLGLDYEQDRPLSGRAL